MRVFIAVLLLVAGSASAVDTWTCQDYGQTVVCSGYQGGKWVTCTTNRFGGTSTTTCN